MIAKECDSMDTGDLCVKAGQAAEKQMAHYLQRAFGHDEGIVVINGLRLVWEGEVCQIDHLVVHSYGMAIVESKSVTSVVKINADGSWERIWNNHWQGMGSPVLQAQRQADFLRGYLNAHKEQLLKRRLGFQPAFDKLPIATHVAISDKGRIERSPHAEAACVFKADQVPFEIKQEYEAEKKKDSVLSLNPAMPTWMMGQEAIARIVAFLLENHSPSSPGKSRISAPVPMERQGPPMTPPPVEATTPVPKTPETPVKAPDGCAIRMQTSTCPECGKTMDILWGDRYKNYYWHCQACGKNVSTKEKCPQCQGKLKIRKQLTKFFLYCETCKVEGLYHESEK